MDLSKISDYCFSHFPDFLNFNSTSNESYYELFKSCVENEGEENNCPVAISPLCAAAVGVGVASLIAFIAGKYLLKTKTPATPLEKIQEFNRVDKKKYYSEELEKAFLPIFAKRGEILMKMKERNIWNDPEFQREFSQYMEESFKLTEIMFQELKRVSALHPLKKNSQQELMARLLIHQWKNEKEPMFLYAFFAFAHLYRLARSRMYIENDRFEKPPELSEADEDLFLLDEEAPEFRWRQLNNTFRENFLALGFEKEVKRFDERVWNFVGFPDEIRLINGHGVFQMPTLLSYHNHLKSLS